MLKKKETYRSWFLINQNKKDRPFTLDEQAAAENFVSFLSDKDYGQGILLFRFDIYIDPVINFGHHHDSVYTACAHLSANIDYKVFIKSDDKYRHKLLLNTALVLCKYFGQNIWEICQAI